MGLLDRFKKPQPQSTAPVTSAPVAPSGIISFVKEAAVSLEKQGAAEERAAVYLVADHSGSMTQFYIDGSMQDLAEKVLGMSANLDDDGIVPVVFFESRAHRPVEVGLDNYEGWMQRAHQSIPWGSTNYVSAMDAVAKHYRGSKAKDPALVIFQTDGQPDSTTAVEKALRDYSGQPIFWFFVGFGPGAVYLNGLPHLARRTFGNVGVFQAGSHPKSVSASSLYEVLSMEFSRMLNDARVQGVLR